MLVVSVQQSRPLMIRPSVTLRIHSLGQWLPLLPLLLLLTTVQKNGDATHVFALIGLNSTCNRCKCRKRSHYHFDSVGGVPLF